MPVASDLLTVCEANRPARSWTLINRKGNAMKKLFILTLVVTLAAGLTGYAEFLDVETRTVRTDLTYDPSFGSGGAWGAELGVPSATSYLGLMMDEDLVEQSQSPASEQEVDYMDEPLSS